MAIREDCYIEQQFHTRMLRCVISETAKKVGKKYETELLHSMICAQVTNKYLHSTSSPKLDELCTEERQVFVASESDKERMSIKYTSRDRK